MLVSSLPIARPLAAGALVCVLASCGGSPTASGGTNDGEPTTAEETYAEYADMPEGEERVDALVKAAQEEGELVINSAASVVAELAPEFEKEYGIKVRLVEPTSSEAQRQRILQEHQAGRVSADVLVTYASDLSHVYREEGITATYASDVTKKLDAEGVQSENYTAIYQYPVVMQYNTDLVSKDELPTSYADLADPKWKGKLGLVRGDGNWYYTLHDALTSDGMSDAEFEKIFKGIAANSRAFDGHGTASLVAAGEVPLLVNGFQLFTESLAAEGSPIASEPYLEPIVMLTFGSGLVASAEHPAAAVLFTEWIIAEGQQTIADNYYYPVNVDAIPGGIPFSVEDFELAHEPVDEIDAEEYGQWQTAFDNLTSGKADILP